VRPPPSDGPDPWASAGPVGAAPRAAAGNPGDTDLPGPPPSTPEAADSASGPGAAGRAALPKERVVAAMGRGIPASLHTAGSALSSGEEYGVRSPRWLSRTLVIAVRRMVAMGEQWWEGVDGIDGGAVGVEPHTCRTHGSCVLRTPITGCGGIGGPPDHRRSSGGRGGHRLAVVARLRGPGRGIHFAGVSGAGTAGACPPPAAVSGCPRTAGVGQGEGGVETLDAGDTRPFQTKL